MYLSRPSVTNVLSLLASVEVIAAAVPGLHWNGTTTLRISTSRIVGAKASPDLQFQAHFLSTASNHQTGHLFASAPTVPGAKTALFPSNSASAHATSRVAPVPDLVATVLALTATSTGYAAPHFDFAIQNATSTSIGSGILPTGASFIFASTASTQSYVTAAFVTMVTTTHVPNAVDVLLSALPSDIASSLVSEFHTVTSNVALSIAEASVLSQSPFPSVLTSQSDAVASTSSQPITTSTTPLSTSTILTSQSAAVASISSQPITTSTTPLSTSTISIPTLSSTTSFSASTSSTPTTFVTVASSRAPSTSPSQSFSPSSAAASDTATAPSLQLKNASIAGITTGVAAGIVSLLLIVVFLLRRRAQGKSPFHPGSISSARNSKGIFPEVAWLYDPTRTPSQRSRAVPETRSSAAILLPAPRHGAAVEMESAAQASPSPLLGHRREAEEEAADTAPLLAPAPTAARRF